MTDIPEEATLDWRRIACGRYEQIAEQIKRDKEENARKRKEGRSRGELTQSLKDHLRNCNPQQLQNAIALCREFLKDHSVAPSPYECHRNFRGITVLVSVAVGNKRARLPKV